jgi:hypothetical protein
VLTRFSCVDPELRKPDDQHLRLSGIEDARTREIRKEEKGKLAIILI